jgi:hypothetical protein
LGCKGSNGATPSDLASNNDGGAVPMQDGSIDGSDPTVGPVKIVSFTSNVATISDSTSSSKTDTVTFFAIVTDTHGIDSLAGGTLQDDTGVTYSAFGTGASKGTYTATVNWQQIQQVRSIDFSPPNPGTRLFKAVFYDNGGSSATATRPITLNCGPSAEYGACGGFCSDFWSPGTCSACNLQCQNYGWRGGVLQNTSCNDFCKKSNQICVDQCSVAYGPGVSGSGARESLDGTTANWANWASYDCNGMGGMGTQINCCCGYPTSKP